MELWSIFESHALKEKYDLRIVEDAAQALEPWTPTWEAPGSCDVGGAISFYPAKVLGCLGDGGAIVTNDLIFWITACLYENHGLDSLGLCQTLVETRV